MDNNEIVIKTKNLWIRYSFGGAGLFKKLYVHAVNDVSLEIKKGEIFGLIGESGSGKTTLGKGILRLMDIYSGNVYWRVDGSKLVDITKLSDNALRKLRKDFQMIQQDPYGALDPRMTIYEILAEGLKLHKLVSDKGQEIEEIYKILSVVKLTPPEIFVNKKPMELSGGQRQRVVVARALLLKPKFIVADEPISMVDASTRGQILEFILNDKNQRVQLTYL